MIAIDLSRWNLTIPAGATIIQTAELQTYKSEYFVRNADGSITFYAPSSGIGIDSTANSNYPRSELRETLENGDDREANWSLDSAEIHHLSAVLRVDSLAKSGKAIVGQFHGEGDRPPFKLQVMWIEGTDRFRVYMQHRPVHAGTEYKPAFATEIALGETFAYEASVTAAGLLAVTLTTAARAETLTAQLDADSYADDTWYAKAGMYSQEMVGGEGAGMATFFALNMYHGAKVAAAVPAQPGQEAVAEPSQDDVIAGTNGDDVLDGGAGRDRLTGSSGGDVFRFSAREHSCRTDSASFTDLITDFDPDQDRIDLSALGFTGFGDGRNGTLLVQTNAEGTRTYLKSYDADAAGRRFEVALDGNHVGALVVGSNVWLTRDDAIRGHLAVVTWHQGVIAGHMAAIEAICAPL